jgi:hypothetical protein
VSGSKLENPLERICPSALGSLPSQSVSAPSGRMLNRFRPRGVILPWMIPMGRRSLSRDSDSRTAFFLLVRRIALLPGRLAAAGAGDPTGLRPVLRFPSAGTGRPVAASISND